MKSAAGLIIYKRINHIVHYLLLQTSYGIHHWTPPKGHLDPGESERDAAIRETKEEAGLLESDLIFHWDFKRTLNYLVKGVSKPVTYWLAELKKEDTLILLSDEHQAFKWLPVEEACQYAVYDDMKKVFEEADIYIKNVLGV